MATCPTPTRNRFDFLDLLAGRARPGGSAPAVLSSPSRHGRALALAVLALGLATGPAAAAGKALAAPGDPPPAPVIHIIRSVTPEERARREREEAARRERARPAVVAWSRAYRPAEAAVRSALREAQASLAVALGPASRNLGYPVKVAVAALEARVPLPAPDPELDRRLKRALLHLKEGAEACRRGQPTVAQMRLYEGQRWLDLAGEVLRSYAEP
jgi:hypothetical protein